MTTAKKLWLGFGILTAVLVLSVAGTALWLRALDKDFQAVVSVSAPLLQAVYEMEINANGTGSAVQRSEFHRPDVPPVVKITGRLLSDAEHGERCGISVEDNGIGFEEIYLDRIFEGLPALARPQRV